jgi:hypothetical protein
VLFRERSECLRIHTLSLLEHLLKPPGHHTDQQHARLSPNVLEGVCRPGSDDTIYRAVKDLGFSHVSARPKAYEQDADAMDASSAKPPSRGSRLAGFSQSERSNFPGGAHF